MANADEKRGMIGWMITSALWLAFAIVVLSIAYLAVWSFQIEVWAFACFCTGWVVWGLSNGSRKNVNRGLACGILGAVLGAAGAVALDYFAFPKRAAYCLWLQDAIILASTSGCCVGIFIERRLSGLRLPRFYELAKQVPSILGIGVVAACSCAFASAVVFLVAGIAGVSVGMAVIELHLRLKADVPEIQNWLETVPANAGELSAASLPAAIEDLHPSRVKVASGCARLRFAWSRMNDYTVVIRPRSQCKNWLDAMDTGYVEH